MHTDQQGKEEAIWSYFQDLLGETRHRPNSLNLPMLGINPVDLTDQDAQFTAEEVRAAIMEMPSDRAPGTDGYTALFFKKCWPVISSDMMRAIRALEQSTSRNLHLLNSAHMILLPKTPAAAHP